MAGYYLGRLEFNVENAKYPNNSPEINVLDNFNRVNRITVKT